MVSVNLTLLSATISFLLRTHLSAEKTGNTKRYLRLKFDGGSRGINALGSGGAILHECFSSITDGFNAVAATNLNKGVLVSEEPDDLIMPRYPTNTSALNRPCSAQFVEETADSTIEVELWRGSFFFGDGISSHVAEYLSLIEGLYAVRSAIRLGMGSLIEDARNHEMFGLVDSLISPGCTTDNYDRNIEDTRTQRSDDINGKQEVLDSSNYSILIQGDSEILVKNLVNGYEPRNKDLRSPHILAASLLKSLTKNDVKGEELHRLQHSAYSLRHIPRKKNILADALATQGIFSRKTRSIIPIEYESPFSSTKIEMNQNHEDLQINRKAVVTESERDMYSVDPVISHDDYEGNKRNLIAKTVEENYGGMYFIKTLSSKVPKHCQSHFLGYALSCSVGDISMNIPVTFHSNTKMKRTFLGVKTFQKKIQNPNIRVTGTPSDEKDGGDESDIDNIVCIDNFQFSNAFNAEKVTLKLSKIKNVNLNLNSSTEQIGTKSDLDDCAVEIAEDDEISSSVSFNGDLHFETIGGGTVQFCVELGPRIDHFDTKKEDLKRDSESEEGERKGEYYNDDIRNRRQRQGEKSDSDSHNCDLLHRQYYISLPLPAPQSPPLVPTYPRDALTLNPSHLSSIVLDNSTAHPYKPQNNYTESAGIEIQGPELNDPRDVLHLEVQLNHHDISSLRSAAATVLSNISVHTIEKLYTSKGNPKFSFYVS